MALTWKKEYTRYRSFFMNIYRIYKTRPDVKMFLEIVLSLFTISFFTLVALRPTALTITQLLDDIKTKQDIADRLDAKIENIKTAQNVLSQAGTRTNVITDALPDSPSPDTFARQIEGIAKNRGIRVNNLVVDETVLIGQQRQVQRNEELENLPDGTGEVIFSLNAVGGYDSLTTFLTDLENLRRLVKIDHAIINIAELEEGRLLTMSITGRIPYYKVEDSSK